MSSRAVRQFRLCHPGQHQTLARILEDRQKKPYSDEYSLGCPDHLSLLGSLRGKYRSGYRPRAKERCIGVESRRPLHSLLPLRYSEFEPTKERPRGKKRLRRKELLDLLLTVRASPHHSSYAVDRDAGYSHHEPDLEPEC